MVFSCSDDGPTSPGTDSPDEETQVNGGEDENGDDVETYTLSVEVTPDGSGEVDPSEGEFEEGEQLELSAQPDDA